MSATAKDRQLFGGPILVQVEGELSQPPAAWAIGVETPTGGCSGVRETLP